MNDQIDIAKRGPGRPPNPRPDMREDDPRARAAKRAAEIREHNKGNMEGTSDDFAVDPTIIPDGWCYEWKMETCLGKEDPAYNVGLRQKGWDPVPASRHPQFMPDGSNDPHIRRKGMVLMERPQELTDEARDIERRRAREQVRNKEEQLMGAPAGQFERSQKALKVGHAYEPIPIPK